MTKIYREEKDLLGKQTINRNCYWGIHTQRAVGNFPNSGPPVSGELIRAMALVKKAACTANLELGFMPLHKASPIMSACDEIASGLLSDQFPLGTLQGGAGTSFNLNINEVITNRALEISGKEKGDYDSIHPLEDVNKHQSTNDTFPTAIKIAAANLLNRLSADLTKLQNAFQTKEDEFSGIVTIGRTELQEAVPITLGAQFGAFSEAFARDRWRCFKACERIRTVNIGGTAIGTGLTAPKSYIFLVIEKLRELTGLPLMRGENCVDQTANADVFVEVSATLKACAANMIKISGDLRLLHMSGEMSLPPVQAGSSIMPGKINPVIPEYLIQAGMKVRANDTIVSDCASAGSLQINEFLPLLSGSLIESLELLCDMAATLTKHTRGIRANEKVCAELAESSHGLITAFVPVVGYEKATDLIRAFSQSSKTNLKDFLTEELGSEIVEQVLSPHNLVSLGYR